MICNYLVSLRTQTYFRLSLVSTEKNICKPEPGNDFCDVGILSQSQFSSSSARATARGICCEEHMESDWSRRNKSHYVTEILSWLGFADVIFGGDKRQPEKRLR